MKKRSRKRPKIPALINKINSLDPISRKDLAKSCGTTIGNLRQIAYGYSGVSPKLASQIIKNCGCTVTLEQLIPDLAT